MIKIKKLSLLALMALLGLSACDHQGDFIEKSDLEGGYVNTSNSKTRSIEDVKNLAYIFLKTDKNSRKSNDMDVEVLTFSKLIALGVNESLKLNTDLDTLIYFVDIPDDNKGGLLLSANKECNLLLAMLDNSEFTFDKILKEKENNLGILAFLLTAADYNLNPNFYNQINEKSSKSYRTTTASLFEELTPKVKVEWGQSGSPYDKYTPNNWPAGCVATAVAQAMTVTRHLSAFNEVDLDFDDLIKFRTSNDFYRTSFPNQADTIGMLLRQIGIAVGMNYGAGGSGAKTKDGVDIFTNFGAMNLSTNKANIKSILKDYNNGIVIISSRTKKDFLGIPRGEGHAYIADGYKVFSDGSDLIHVNYGWNGYGNGYFLSNLIAPHFTEDAPEIFPHSWDFYCIYK